MGSSHTPRRGDRSEQEPAPNIPGTGPAAAGVSASRFRLGRMLAGRRMGSARERQRRHRVQRHRRELHPARRPGDGAWTSRWFKRPFTTPSRRSSKRYEPYLSVAARDGQRVEGRGGRGCRVPGAVRRPRLPAADTIPDPQAALNARSQPYLDRQRCRASSSVRRPRMRMLATEYRAATTDGIHAVRRRHGHRPMAADAPE